MRMETERARSLLATEVHGVLCTMHPVRGPDPQPVVYAITDDDHLGVPIDRVKPKVSTRLQREDNLAADPRATLLIEHWEIEDWTRLWWVRAALRYESASAPSVLDDLIDRLSRAAPQYADRPFHRVLVCRIESVTGWSGRR